ncbi:hypothetical protein MNB_SM-6-634 [hydrothermal vent metagenome]|uniref:Uncharacterized protein n=1 Tax=hydrothermal vent metagenome TaxID=652676 RepID=A0A1W1CAD6_9ZZZZ
MHTKKLHSVLDQAQKDLTYWLKVANVKSISEFFEKKEEIRQQSYHNYNDVLEHINFIKKLEAKLGTH